MHCIKYLINYGFYKFGVEVSVFFCINHRKQQKLPLVDTLNGCSESGTPVRFASAVFLWIPMRNYKKKKNHKMAYPLNLTTSLKTTVPTVFCLTHLFILNSCKPIFSHFRTHFNLYKPFMSHRWRQLLLKKIKKSNLVLTVTNTTKN